MENDDLIPKIIHYCWFGRNEKPKKVKKIIDRWKLILKEYNFVEWNEENFCIEECCDFVKKAYKEKKWAFVSDYVRMQVLYKYGGIYLDTDVIILKNFDDYLTENMFVSFESENSLCTAIIGAKPHNILIYNFLELYFSFDFDKNNLKPNSELLYNFLSNFYNQTINFNEETKFNDITIYPRRIFGAKDNKTYKKEVTSDTIAIHNFDASWYNPIHKILHKLKIITMSLFYFSGGKK